MIFAGTIMPALGEKLGRAELCILNETIVRNSSQQPASSTSARALSLLTLLLPSFLPTQQGAIVYAIMGLGSNAPTPWPLYIMFPLYFIRQIVDVSSHLLWFALFADCVPPEQRARWEAFLPFVGAGTSITTGIGGKWIDSYGYGTTFIMTACGQAVPILLLATILPQIGKAATVEAKAKDEAKVMM